MDTRNQSTGRFRNWQFAILLFAPFCSSALAAPSAPVSDPLLPRVPTWHPPQVSDVKAHVDAWLWQNTADAAHREKALAVVKGISDRATGAELLDSLAEAFSLVDPKVAQLVDTCSHPRTRLALPDAAFLADAKTASLVATNMRLYYGRWLVQGQWFEEALEQLGGLKTSDVVAPAELLFYQGVAYHRLLKKEEGLKVINELLDGAEASPRRFITIARLMQANLGALQEETLDHIARRMEDVRRRLELGRPGPKTRKVEDGVVESLDRMIENLEKDPCFPVPGCPGPGSLPVPGLPGSTLRPSRPLQDSMPIPGKAPGDVAKKDIGHKSGWGDMPPKEREEALQQMGRDFPSHYRDAIEEYFRKLAAEQSGNEDE